MKNKIEMVLGIILVIAFAACFAAEICWLACVVAVSVVIVRAGYGIKHIWHKILHR